MTLLRQSTLTHDTSAHAYDNALSWLYAQTRGGRARDPKRMRALMERLELPHPSSSVHVVGTNGKGTVAAAVAAALTASGRRTGRFLSPHVVNFCERVAVDGRLISQQEVTAFVGRVASVMLEPPPAFFEWTLALALRHFFQEQVEAAVLEAGVGARHDATIVLENVRTVVITNVGRDHLDTLGPTPRDIARNKAAAIRPGVPVVTAATGQALVVIAEVAGERGSPLVTKTSHPDLFTLPETFTPANPLHEQNMRLAAAALRVDGRADESAVLCGLESAPLPGRMERFTLRGRSVILDGAHNPSAAGALHKLLLTPYVLVFGSLPKKLGEETLGVLEPHALQTFVTQADAQKSTIQSSSKRCFVEDPVEALGAALDVCPLEACVVVTGSLYLAGRVRPYLVAQQSLGRAVDG